MKRDLIRISIAAAVFAFWFGCLFINQAYAVSGAKLQVLNPRGEPALPPAPVPSGRVADLTGKKKCW
jgi:hypothetical protein